MNARRLEGATVQPSANVKVSFVVVNDARMVEVNKEVFDKNVTTDVISLPINTEIDDKTVYLGEVVVNQDAVQRNAEHYQVTYAQELARVITHGVLHLLGYQDDDSKGRVRMQEIEDVVVQEVGQYAKVKL